MILRKPYALLIKNFKIIHVIFTILALIIFLKCNELLSFINQYIANSGFILESFQINQLFPFYVPLIIIVLISLNIVIAFLLKMKDKGIVFYIVSTVAYAVTLVALLYVSSLLNQMQIRIIDTRTIRALRDIFMIVMGIQLVTTFMYGFRATGFDFKKFNFSKDLVDIEIEEQDNEEVEVAVNVDINQIDRNRRKSIRYLKYFYYENKFISNIVMGVLGLIILIALIFTLINKDPVYKQFQIVQTANYTIEVQDVYVADKNKNNVIVEEDKAFVIMEVKTKKKGNKTVILNLGRFELKTASSTYFHNTAYKDLFDDFGTIYTNQELSTDYNRYFLIFPVKKSDVGKKMYLNYVDTNNDIIVNFNYINMQSDTKRAFSLNEMFKLEDTILDDYELTFTKFELGRNIEVKYKYCITTSNCINAVEYVYPSIASNYDKAVLRLDGTLKFPEEVNSYVVNMEMLITRFGYLKYTKDGKSYTSKFNLGTLKSNKVKQENTTYYEIREEVLSADEVILGIKLRDKSYELVLKGRAE